MVSRVRFVYDEKSRVWAQSPNSYEILGNWSLGLQVPRFPYLQNKENNIWVDQKFCFSFSITFMEKKNQMNFLANTTESAT